MSQAVKTIDFLDLTDQRRITIDSMPPSASDDLHLGPGRKVLVQTIRAKDLKFYIMLEVIEQRQEGFIGSVIGPEGDQGLHNVIYPGKYLKFEFDGMSVDDMVCFEDKNVANVF